MPPYVSVAGLTLLIIATHDIRFRDTFYRAVSAARCHDSDAIAAIRDMQPGALWIVSTVLFVSDSSQEDKSQLGYR